MTIRLLVVSAFLMMGSFAFAEDSYRDYDRAVQMCHDAANRYARQGGDIDVTTWCADTYSVGNAICRKGGLNYVLDYPGAMNVKQWCSDTQSTEEGQCRLVNLRKKARTGYPTNVKAFCKY